MNSTVIPCLRYRDAPAMIEWLCKAFGFEKHVIHANPDGTVAHAQLVRGGGMVMLGSADNGSAYTALSETISPQSSYLMAEDCKAVHASALAAGAEIVLPFEEKDYGGSGFTCRDPEGHLWSVGSYDPWAN